MRLSACASGVVWLVGVCGVFFWAPASAQTTIYYPNNTQIQVPVTATVDAACGFGATVPQGNVNVGELNNSFSQDVPFVLQCSVPSRMAIVSSNGGLLVSGTPPAGYSNLAPYNVALHMVGASLTADGNCPAADLLISSGNACTIRGTASASVGLLLNQASYDVNGGYVRISSPGYSGSDILVSSNAYADTLTVTLSAAP